MANTVSYIYEILDRYSAPLKKISAQTRRFTKATASAQRGARRLSQRMDGMAASGRNLQGALGATALLMGLKKVISASSDMEDAMANVRRVTNLSGSELLAFENKLEGLSESLVVSKIALADMATAGARFGIPVNELDAFINKTVMMGTAFDFTAEEAGMALGSIRAKMGLTGDASMRLLDSVNFLADTTSAQGRNMIEVLERLSGTFKILKIPPEVAAAFAGFADQVEVTPRLAASGMRMMIRQMRKMPGMTQKMMEDPVAAIIVQLERMKTMGPEVQRAFIEKVFGPEAGRFVEKAVSNIDLFVATIEKAASGRAIGSMEREFRINLAKSSSAFKTFAIIITNTLDTIGDVLKPFAVQAGKAFGPILKSIREWAKQNPGIVKAVAAIATAVIVFTALAVAGGLLMAALAPVVALIGTMTLPMVLAAGAVAVLIAGFKQWVETGHPVINTLKTMAADIGAVFTALNKLTGGFFEAGEGVSFFQGFLDRLGSIIQLTLAPLRLILNAIAGIVELTMALASGDLGAALDVFTERWGNFADIFSETGSAAAAVITGSDALNGTEGGGRGVADKVAGRREAIQQAELALIGEIKVSAAPGSTVEEANISLPTGRNMVTR